jgi:hypothetical protein
VKIKVIVLALACLVPLSLLAQEPTRDLVYLGVMGGIATLSGDANALVTPTSASTSLYDPSSSDLHRDVSAPAVVVLHFVTRNSEQPAPKWGISPEFFEVSA